MERKPGYYWIRFDWWPPHMQSEPALFDDDGMVLRIGSQAAMNPVVWPSLIVGERIEPPKKGE